jgi:1-deoxy-D-xylulose-5-phosphate reductoisomerase
MREPIIVLGATGSIGKQCLDILKYSFDYALIGVSLNSHYEVLEPYLGYFDQLKYVAITDQKKANEFHLLHPDFIVLSGDDANLEILRRNKNANVFNSLIGNVGLRPALLALRQNQDLLLSNKESLVIGSSLIKKELEHSSSHLYPVDSEHVGLAKTLNELKKEKIPTKDIDELIVTASGGALRDLPKDEIDSVTPERVLHHPTWLMGPKITVDSATLVNKGYEVIEASVLFDFPVDQVKAVICRESLVHALVKYQKNKKTSYLYEYSPCDMKVSIAYALSKGKLGIHQNTPEDKKQVEKLHFEKIDPDFYPLFPLTIKTFKVFGNVGMIYYNAVDTLAVNSFLKGEIPYSFIRESLRFAFETMPLLPPLTEEGLPEIERQAEKFAEQTLIKVSLLLRR